MFQGLWLIVVVWDGSIVYISDSTYALVLMKKLCKHCPHSEKPFSYSKSISFEQYMITLFNFDTFESQSGHAKKPFKDHM